MPNSAPSQPDLSILIVSYNVSNLLDVCLRTIKEFTRGIRYEIIVVDSASSDDSVAMVRRNHPDVALVAAETNLGFTKGNNVALAKATGRHICYLNPDTELVEDVFTPLVHYLEENSGVGVVAPKLLNTDRSLQNSIGRMTKLSSLMREYFLRTKAEKERRAYPTVPTVVDYAMGACLVVRGDLCRQIGGMDERFFMYHEETDLCLQLTKLGYPTVYDPRVSLIHHGGASSSTEEKRQRTLNENRKSQYLFFQKHFGFIQAQLAKLIILVAMISRLIVLGPLSLLKPSEANKSRVYYFSKTVGWLLTH